MCKDCRTFMCTVILLRLFGNTAVSDWLLLAPTQKVKLPKQKSQKQTSPCMLVSIG